MHKKGEGYMNTYAGAVRIGTEILENAGIADANHDARELLFYVCRLDFSTYMMHGHSEELTESAFLEYEALILQRAKHFPLQYLIGYQNFCGLDFHVNEHVLIPRQDTEILVAHILKEEKAGRGLDMCTGSGCIAISLQKLGDFGEIVAADISDKALDVAKENAKNLDAEVMFIKSDMFMQIPKQKFDFIVSNPPYIRTAVLEELDIEVKKHEPILALDGMEDGLKFYRILAESGREYLNHGGRMYLEIGYDQAKEVCDLLLEQCFCDVNVIQDLAGNDRVVAAKYSSMI